MPCMPAPTWQNTAPRPDDLALIRVKAATYGQLNEKAVYRKPVTFEMFQDPENRMAGPVASPLRVGDCCANADGSSCIIVASEEKAKALSQETGLDSRPGGCVNQRQSGRPGSVHRPDRGAAGRAAGLSNGGHLTPRISMSPKCMTVSPSRK